jgi:hypothetical protein
MYNTHCFSTATMVTRTRLSVTLYVPQSCFPSLKKHAIHKDTKYRSVLSVTSQGTVLRGENMTCVRQRCTGGPHTCDLISSVHCPVVHSVPFIVALSTAAPTGSLIDSGFISFRFRLKPGIKKKHIRLLYLTIMRLSK